MQASGVVSEDDRLSEEVVTQMYVGYGAFGTSATNGRSISCGGNRYDIFRFSRVLHLLSTLRLTFRISSERS